MIIENGKKVTVYYTGKLETGEVFDTNVNSNPLIFTFGVGELIEGFEQGLDGMSIGEKKEISIGYEQAYGERNEEKIQPVNLSLLPQDVQVGVQLQGTAPDGTEFIALVTEINPIVQTTTIMLESDTLMLKAGNQIKICLSKEDNSIENVVIEFDAIINLTKSTINGMLVELKSEPQNIMIGNKIKGSTLDIEFVAEVANVELEQTAMVDTNHPLAGKNLIFEVEVVNVEDAYEVSESMPTIDLGNLEG